MSGVLALENDTFLNTYPTSHLTGEDNVHEGLSRLLELERGQMIAMHFRFIHGGKCDVGHCCYHYSLSLCIYMFYVST